jgi:hypothetical protein
MLLEVCSGGPVSLVLKMLNTWCLTLVLLGSTGKDMGHTAILLLTGDIWSKKWIYPQASGLFSGSLRIKSLTENKKTYYSHYQKSWLLWKFPKKCASKWFDLSLMKYTLYCYKLYTKVDLFIKPEVPITKIKWFIAIIKRVDYCGNT